ncbi:MAG TPA: hypothetical protein VGR22_07475 [Thermomicrobiales bacterium]|nr:hypothetical protein [Thermomicrobiales bacterium]
MTVICPRCNARCGDDDLYCSSCGLPLAGIANEREQASDEAGTARDPVPPAAST